MDRSDWTIAFPDLAGLSEEDRRILLRAAQEVRLGAGATVFRPGSPCTSFLFVLDGSVRVQMTADTGRELLLYRVGPGETCVLTTSCLLGQDDYPAEGVVESETRAVALPLGRFQDLMARSDVFRRFVFHGFGSRLADLLATVEDTVFHGLEGRLARALLDKARDGALDATHQALAAELGTAREVVSRQLKSWERNGFVRLARGRIDIVDRSGLLDRAGVS